MGPPLPWSCVPRPPPSTRHHVQVQSRFTTYQVVIILILTNCISNESRSLSTFVHYRGDLMQCGVGKPFNIPSAKLGIHHHHNFDIIVTIITIIVIIISITIIIVMITLMALAENPIYGILGVNMG